MITDVLFNKTNAGFAYSNRGGITYTLRSDGKFAGVGVDYEPMTVVLNGWYITRDNGNNMYQTINGEYIDLKEGWKRTQQAVTYSAKSAQQLVNDIIESDKAIIANNLLCARFSNKLSTAERKRLYELQTRLQERENALNEDGLVTVTETSYPKGYADLAPYLQKFMLNGGVGVATIVIVIVAATVVASLSTAAYFAYKYFADEAKQDVKYSKELTEILRSKLTDQEYQQLLSETGGIVTKARIKKSISNYSSILTAALIAAGAIFITKKYL